MDLQLSGRTAIVCGAEPPLSHACAAALLAEGVSILLVSSAELPKEVLLALGPEAAPDKLRSVASDLASEAGIDAVMAACPQPDIIVNHAPGFPPGDFRDISADAWLSGVRRVMLPGILLATRVYDGMVQRGFGRIVNITSQCVKAAMANLDISNAARAGLTGFSASLARKGRRGDVTVNGLLPGMFETPALRAHATRLAAERGREVDEVLGELNAGNPLGRLGVPGEFGNVCAFICSPRGAYINGQNILVDGGLFPGVV